MRGKAYVLREDLPDVGITPAYAGKSPALRPEFATEQDHPRLCGEKLYADNKRLEEEGSPPPMRGKVN